MAGIAWNSGSAGSWGGTEQMGRALERHLPAELLGRFQILLTRAEPEEPGKLQVLWCHLGQDAPDVAYLANGGWRRFHRIIFVSNWQAQGFIGRFGIPWSRCAVLLNAIEPVSVGEGRFEPVPADQPIRLVYTSVPDRGLLLLYHVFRGIAAAREDVELDVFSSFRLYGWDDGPYQRLLGALQQVPRVTWHGAVPHAQLQKALAEAHVLAFPSVATEVCALSLMEAMSAGLACVHPNFGALYETAANWTVMYQWHEDPAAHVAVCYENLMQVIDALRAGDEQLRSGLAAQKAYADRYYSWASRAVQWEELLVRIIQENAAAP